MAIRGWQVSTVSNRPMQTMKQSIPQIKRPTVDSPKVRLVSIEKKKILNKQKALSILCTCENIFAPQFNSPLSILLLRFLLLCLIKQKLINYYYLPVMCPSLWSNQGPTRQSTSIDKLFVIPWFFYTYLCYCP